MKELYYDDIGQYYTKTKKEVKRKRGLFRRLLEISANLTRGTPTLIGYGLRRIIYKLLLKKCGKGLIIHPYVFIKFPENIEIGDYCSINPFSFINGLNGLKIGKNVSLSAGSYIIAQTVQNERMEALGYSKMDDKKKGPVEIGDHSWLAAGVLIGPGLKIGKYSQIASNSVVLEDVPDYTFVGGTPAKVIRQLSKDKIKLLER